MSLIAWYPLNGNLNNQGVGDMDLTVSSTPTYTANGKIGKALSGGGAATWTAAQTASILNNNALSICFWIYVVDSTATQQIFGTSGMTASNNRKFSIFEYPTANDLHLSWQNDADTTYLSCVRTGVFPTGKWTHCAITYQNPKATIYINGVEDWTSNAVSNSSTFAYTTQVLRTSTGRYLNDYRFYDHCLSQREVKEIAKGLILHYPMNQCDGIIGGRNLLANSKIVDYGNTKFNNNVFTQATADTATTINFKFQLWSQGVYKIQSFNQAISTPGVFTKTFTLNPGGNIIDSIRFGLNGSKIDTCVRYEIDSIDTSDTYTLTINFLNVTQGSVAWTDVKLEKNSVTTAWTPAPEDAGTYDDNIVYDCSGYGYNGSCATSTQPIWSDDCIIGQGSYNFASNKKIIAPALPTAGLANSYTIAWWANASTLTSKMCWGFGDGNRLNYYGGLYNNTGDGSSNPFQNPGTTTTITMPSVNVWHHYVMTGDGSSSKLYVDGIHYGTAKVYKPITGTIIYLNGWSSGTDYCFNGLMNDFRIYATALSAADVKDLYETRMSVADNGTFFCTEFVEPDDMMGGRNLAYSSTTMANLGNAGASACSKTIEANTEAASGTIVKYTCTTAGSGGGPYASGLFARARCIEGKVYTWSIWVKSSVAKTFTSFGHECGGIKNSVAVTTSWQKITHTYTANSSQYSAFVFYGPWAAGDILYVKDCKIEEGSMATPWCPALEDYGVSIDNAVSRDPQFFSTGLAQAGLVETDDKQMQMTDYHIGMEQLIEW